MRKNSIVVGGVYRGRSGKMRLVVEEGYNSLRNGLHVSNPDYVMFVTGDDTRELQWKRDDKREWRWCQKTFFGRDSVCRLPDIERELSEVK